MTDDLPAWVWDLIIDLEDQRDTHPQLLYQPAGTPGVAPYGWCPCTALRRVPAEIRATAQALRTALAGPAGPDEEALRGRCARRHIIAPQGGGTGGQWYCRGPLGHDGDCTPHPEADA